MREKVCGVKLSVLLLVGLGCAAAAAAAHQIDVAGGQRGSYLWDRAFTGNEQGAVAVVFEVTGFNDAHVAFAEWPSDDSPLYEVVLGGWDNTRSVIRKGRQAAVRAEVTAAQRRDAVLGGAYMTAFWIKVERGFIEVGSGRVIGAQRFLSWQDPDPLGSPRHVAFSSWDTPVQYNLLESRQPVAAVETRRPWVGEHPTWNALPVVECESGHTYGRGAGFGYVPLFEERKHARRRCEKEHGACEIWGEMYYPKCKGGYAPVGCCLCRCFL